MSHYHICFSNCADDKGLLKASSGTRHEVDFGSSHEAHIYLQIATAVQRTATQTNSADFIADEANNQHRHTTDTLKVFCQLFFAFQMPVTWVPPPNPTATHLHTSSPTPSLASNALCMARGKNATIGEHAKIQGLHSCQWARSWPWSLLPALTPITTMWVSATGPCCYIGICSWPLQLNVHTPLDPATTGSCPGPWLPELALPATADPMVLAKDHTVVDAMCHSILSQGDIIPD